MSFCFLNVFVAVLVENGTRTDQAMNGLKASELQVQLIWTRDRRLSIPLRLRTCQRDDEVTRDGLDS